jgi:DHA2 family multidrug resistance protein
MMFVMGAVSFSSTVLLPQFLQTLMGYTAQEAGMVISVAAILLFILMPLVGRLAGHFQARRILAFGWIALAVAMYFSCKQIDLLISFRSAAWMRIWQYAPVGFLFVPATMAAYVGLPESKNNAAAGLINFMRNIGQSVGTSTVTTLLARRSQYHQSVLAESTRSARFDTAVTGLTTQLTQVGLSTHAAHEQALARMYGMVLGQAQTLSYVDVYWLLAAVSALMFLLSFLLAKNEPGAGGKVVME